MKTSATIFATLFAMSSLLAQDIEFFREDLTFRLEEGFFSVEGDYFFRNTTDGEVKNLLLYPFPDNEIYGSIIELNINVKDNSTSMITGSSEEGAAFKLKLGPMEEATYRISYVQRLKSNVARYIITTTKQWGKELEAATYRLVVPASIQLDSISILPDTMITTGSHHYFLWDRQNFMPEVDFIFQFSRSTGND